MVIIILISALCMSPADHFQSTKTIWMKNVGDWQLVMTEQRYVPPKGQPDYRIYQLHRLHRGSGEFAGTIWEQASNSSRTIAPVDADWTLIGGTEIVALVYHRDQEVWAVADCTTLTPRDNALGSTLNRDACRLFLGSDTGAAGSVKVVSLVKGTDAEPYIVRLEGQRRTGEPLVEEWRLALIDGGYRWTRR